jgi:hypothetical protein
MQAMTSVARTAHQLFIGGFEISAGMVLASSSSLNPAVLSRSDRTDSSEQVSQEPTSVMRARLQRVRCQAAARMVPVASSPWPAGAGRVVAEHRPGSSSGGPGRSLAMISSAALHNRSRPVAGRPRRKLALPGRPGRHSGLVVDGAAGHLANCWAAVAGMADATPACSSTHIRYCTLLCVTRRNSETGSE